MFSINSMCFYKNLLTKRFLQKKCGWPPGVIFFSANYNKKLFWGGIYNSTMVDCRMDSIVEGVYFSLLNPPNVRVRKPTWLVLPGPMTIFGFVLFTYFLVCGGIIYDVIVEPPSVGSTTDERGNSKPVAFMPYRVNGQYIMEGLAASFMFTLGGLGFIILDLANNPLLPKLNRTMMLSCGFGFVLISFMACRVFMRMKLPGYLQG